MRNRLISGMLVLFLAGVAPGAENPNVTYRSNSLTDEGIRAYRQENFEEAVALLESARKEAPESGVTAFYLGLAYKQTGELSRAGDQLRLAADSQPPVLDAYLELGELAYTQEEYEEALAWTEKAAAQGVKPGHPEFLKGLIQAKRENFSEALASFAQAKAKAPELTQAVDLQRAMLLANTRRFADASEALRAVVSIDPASSLAAYAHEYELLLKRAAENYRTWHLKVGIGGLYDDNVVAKPDANIPGLEITNTSDSGFIGTFQLDYTPLIPKGWLFNGHYALQSTTYSTIGTHNTIQHALSLVPGREYATWSLTLPVSYNHLLLNEENYLSQTIVRPSVSMVVAEDQILSASVGYSRREMLQTPLDHDENRDANLFMIDSGYLAAIRALPATVSVRYEFTFDRTEGRNWENRSHRVAGSLLVPVREKLSCNLGADALFQQYLNRHSTFDVVRHDTLLNLGGGCTWNLLSELALQAQYTYSNAASNIPAYDYQRNQVTFGLEYTF